MKFSFELPDLFRNHTSLLNTFHQNKIRNFESMLTRNSLLLQVQEEITEHGITHILLRELINIKHTLKVSSKEIQNLFKYPMSLLINEKTNTSNTENCHYPEG